MANKGNKTVTHQTINGPVKITRKVYWSSQAGMVAPADHWLGIAENRYSPGLREMVCRLSLNEAFVPASKNLKRLVQVTLSSSAIRSIVEHQGKCVLAQQASGQFPVGFTAEDCTDQTMITGVDGVMVPHVTQEQKRKRRETEKAKRKSQSRRSTAKRGRGKKGADGPYKEFKIVTFYDTDKQHKHVIGTRGNHHKLGKLMRREASKLKLDKARRKYSVTDGASWILKQYNQQLPMLDDNILDYYHLRDHVIKTSHTLYGEGTEEAVCWRQDMMAVVWKQGSLVFLDRLSDHYKTLRSPAKRQTIKSLQKYIATRVEMTDYPTFRAKGYDCGSGPTESFCGCLTRRLKGRGMRWDGDNAESIMALASIYYTDQWRRYWNSQKKAA
ncbi:MAG: hypothetical protein IIB56_05295 [Planctomycetes bacterium]|nr:hypothetical protein [Planctomycetota bacterium]